MAHKDIVVLTDSEGNELECDYLDTVNFGDKDYVVLYPVDQESDDDEGEVIILELVMGDNGIEDYLPVEDGGLLDSIFAEYMRISQLDEEEDDD